MSLYKFCNLFFSSEEEDTSEEEEEKEEEKAESDNENEINDTNEQSEESQKDITKNDDSNAQTSDINVNEKDTSVSESLQKLSLDKCDSTKEKSSKKEVGDQRWHNYFLEFCFDIFDMFLKLCSVLLTANSQ